MLHAKVEPQIRETIHAEMNQTNDKRWYMRLKIIDLSSQGQSVSLLAQVFDLSEATIRSYIHRFNATGMTGLRPSYGIGRPAKLTWTQAEWLDVLAQSPANLPRLVSQARNWTQALLCQYLHAYHQIEVTQPTVAKQLRQVGIRWRRAKLRVHSPDPLYQVKRQRIQHLQQMALGGDLTSHMAAHPRSDEPPKPAFLVFLDSTDLHWCPDLGNTYTATGTQMKVDSPGFANPWYALFGSLIFPSGEVITPYTNASAMTNFWFTSRAYSRWRPTLSGLLCLIMLRLTQLPLSKRLPNSIRHSWNWSICQLIVRISTILSVSGISCGGK